MERAFIRLDKEYKRHQEEYEEKVLRMAEEKHWAYDLVAGNNTLLKKLVDGEWDEKNFLVVPPNCCAVESYDEEIMKLGTGHF